MDIFLGSFNEAEIILLLLKIRELNLYPSLITSCGLTFQECKNFSLFQKIKSLFHVAKMKIMMGEVGRTDLFVESLTKSKSK